MYFQAQQCLLSISACGCMCSFIFLLCNVLFFCIMQLRRLKFEVGNRGEVILNAVHSGCFTTEKCTLYTKRPSAGGKRHLVHTKQQAMVSLDEPQVCAISPSFSTFMPVERRPLYFKLTSFLRCPNLD